MGHSPIENLRTKDLCRTLCKAHQRLFSFARNVVRTFVVAFAVITVSASAQTLPPPSRTVYKCESGKQTHYSDTPCLGAKKVDVEPTRGFNKSTGQEKIGQDVMHEKHNEQMADALRPLLNETPEQRTTRQKRFKLDPSVKLECARLDFQIPRLESQERSAARATLPVIQQDLLAARTQFQRLRC